MSCAVLRGRPGSLVLGAVLAASASAQAGRIEGLVADEAGAGLAGAAIYAQAPLADVFAPAQDPPCSVSLEERAAWPDARARTDAAGAFRIDGLDPTVAYLVYALTPSGDLTDCVHARPGREPVRLSSREPPPITLSVRGADGEPLAGARVSLRMKSPGWGWSESVPMEPTFVPGLYGVLSVRRLVRGDWIAQVEHPDHSVGYSGRVELGGDRAWSGDVALEPPRTVGIAVANSAAARGALAVRVQESLPSPAGAEWWVATREHDVELANGEGIEIRVSRGSALDAALVEDERILAQARAGPSEDAIALAVPERYPLSGTVDAGGSPPEGRVVVVAVSAERTLRLDLDRLALAEHRYSYSSEASWIGAQGLRFDLGDLPAGTYRAFALRWPEGSTTHAVPVPSGAGIPGCVLWEHERAGTLALELPGSIAIEGETTFGGARTGEVLVQLWSTGPGGVELQATTSDGEGCFRFGRVPYGVYRIRAFSPDFMCPSVALVDPDVTRGAPVELSFGVALSGVLADARGAPIQGAEVCVFPRLDRSLEDLPGMYARNELASYFPGPPHGIESALPARGKKPWKHFSTTTTDERGRFAAFGVPPGQCIAEAYLAGGEIVRWPLRVSADGPRVLLQVLETGTLSVRRPEDAGSPDGPDGLHVRLVGDGAELSVIDNPADAVLAGMPANAWPRVFEGLQPGRYAVDYLRYGNTDAEPRVVRTVECWVRSGEQTDLR